MPLLLGGLIGLGAGLIAHGSVQNLSRVRLRWPRVVIVSLVIKEAGVLTPLSHSQLAPVLYTSSLIALLGWVVWHARVLPGLWVLALGIVFNLAVVIANGGHMPVDPTLVGRGSEHLAGTTVGQYVMGGPDTRLAFLDDRLVMPGPLRILMPSAYSVGDLVAGLGMAITLFLGVRRSNGEQEQLGQI